MKRHTIIFFDSNKKNIKEYQNILSNIKCNINLLFIHSDFEKILAKNLLHATVSPANSYLSMTGGIDNIYTKCFPNIEDKLRKISNKKKYAISDIEYKKTHYIVPVGKCIVSQTDNRKCPYIIAAPTMKTPKDINNTNNVYLAMCAILNKIKMLDKAIIIGCPCLGTGIGNLCPKESAIQIKKALLEN
uniref:Macrodomain-containing protein n=1 Tax=Moumouvirus sp. 'Monve' TaxID=1128131 RepID=H2EFA6_9VIRU|nr:macrodomain-containing protein [Moumouvirus Monve]